MIPRSLTLRNFLSYREATLDFRGLHTACVCGANGAGKSSLLEAIAWAIWGESRVSSEDDVIHIGTKEATVEFIFSLHQQTYRVVRSRHRSQGVSLEFQIAQDPDGSQLRSLSAKTIRATQQLVFDHLKLDYDTFVNSAYLRQGRADEFMLKRPAERKQILADLLKLQQYDDLAEQSKDQSRQFKGQVELLERNLAYTEAQLQQRGAIAQERLELETVLQQMQATQAASTEHLQHLQAQQQQRQHYQQQLTWQQQQQRNLSQDCQRLQKELAQAQQQQQNLDIVLSQEGAIAAGYSHWQTLQAQEETLATKFQAHQVAQAQRQHYQQQQSEKLNLLHNQLQQLCTQDAAFEEQLQEIERSLAKEAEISAGVSQLQEARSQLQRLDQRQLEAMPLLQRRQQLQATFDRASTRLSARLDELRTSLQQLHPHQQRQPHLQKAAVEIALRIEELEKLQAYQEQVRDKGLERRAFMERLQAQQRSYETQIAEIDHKIRLLQAEHLPSQAIEGHQGVASEWRATAEGADAQTVTVTKLKPLNLHPQPFPPCPLCSRPLDEHHWQLVQQKHQEQKQEVLAQVWVVREQLTVSEREIQVLRQEYVEIDQKLKHYGQTLERRGQLQEQLQTTAEVQKKLEQLTAEAMQVDSTLKSGEFEKDVQQELELLNQSLQQINYDERDHALARGAVDRWRWAEIKFVEIKQARKRQEQIANRQPALRSQITTLEQQIEALKHHLAIALAERDRQIADIGYNLDQHNAIRTALRNAQSWQLRHQELRQAQQHYPQAQQRSQDLSQTLQVRLNDLTTITHQCQELIRYLEQTPDLASPIHTVEQQIQQQRLQLDQHIVQLGRVQQQQQQQEALSRDYEALTMQLHTARQQSRVYQELAQAFGKNGIQALMIENILPQLEAATNQILSRLSANQLHVQFATQRARHAKSKITKAMETLDILIADAHGTRPYETYSGGEAFRVNFAVRLALARLLSQRAGTALQMLIVDEGFGTQDQDGCDRLIAAINAIAPEFACILTITHMPYFREAFQARIEVAKTQDGSQIDLCL
ncbi:AAA family ATPase [Myxacorys almedinensis]|uniref:Nuclease SbcCD subunit C n=1 Tax=Myxacorys almedinensis A TaxID=2690445 RepID=A0A8J7Z352_9CYAN|nr:SMC family ATPase [Myxacorys almedinensis]NDJ18415.1 AAA family ATPase [Myxacorys almedinensis A]